MGLGRPTRVSTSLEKKQHHERGQKQEVDGVSDTHFPKVKPMNLFLLVSRKCSMSFSLHKHTQAAVKLAVNGLVWDMLVSVLGPFIPL